MRVALLGVLLLLWTGSAAAQTKPLILGEKGKKIDELMRAYEREGLLSGTVLVAEKGQPIYKRGFGYAVAEFKVPNDGRTKFRLASVSKPIIAMLVMKLVDQGKITLDDKLSKYMPDFRKEADAITVRHLLSHTHGIPGGIGDFGAREMRDPATRDELVRAAAEGPMDFEPGTRYRYGLIGNVLLSVIVEKMTGKPYDQALKELVLDPLSMRDTGVEGQAGFVSRAQGRMVLNNPVAAIERMAFGYVKTRTGYVRAPYMDLSRGGAGAAVYSTVEDLFRLDQALYGDRLLSSGAKEAMFSPVLNGAGLGWDLRNITLADLQRPQLPLFGYDPARANAPIKMQIKGGDIWGYTAYWVRIPEARRTIIILANGGNIFFNTDVVRMTQGILAILYDQPYSTPREKFFVDMLQQRGYDETIRQYNALRTKSASALLNEPVINQWGYDLVNKGETALAILVFRLNTHAFPTSANAYDSLAEAYETAGNKAEAIAGYEKALALLSADSSLNEAGKNQLRVHAEERLRALKGS